MRRRWWAFLGVAVVAATLAAAAWALFFRSAHSLQTATPIKHLVVIYQENVSFDHYFGTYPYATNPSGEPKFYAAPFTPRVNNLEQDNLLTNNPNLNPANGAGATNPFRLDRTQVATSDQNHSYTPEQQAEDNGKMDLFPKYTGTASSGGAGAFGTTGQVMGYYDGNTVTAMWNYAQHFAMSDDAYGAGYGPSTPGAIEAISGQTNGYEAVVGAMSEAFVSDGQGGYTNIGDEDPAHDICSIAAAPQMAMLGRNIGDLLNARDISWGGFMGGFDLTLTNANGTTGCQRSSTSAYTGTSADYVPHHNWFQYYASTANPTHARPISDAAIGHTHDADGAIDPANHEYDLNDFYTAVERGNFPAVAYIKAPAYQDGHAGYSDPLDEQAFIVQLVNFLEQRPQWRDTAIVISYDDSDGWYDHQYVSPISASFSSADQLNGRGECGAGTQMRPDGLGPGLPVNGRCGPGPRLPFIVISPYARPNYVSHQYITQASVVRFIEDNWLQGERLGGGSFDATAGSLMDLFDFRAPHLNEPLFLDARSGEPVDHSLSVMAQLGERLFHDAHLSGSGRLSCASCHDPARAYGPPGADAVVLGGASVRTSGYRAVPSLRYLYRQPPFTIGPDTAADSDGPPQLTQQARRSLSAPRVLKSALDPRAAAANPVPQGGLFWDGRVNTLQQQADGPLFNPVEMGASAQAVLRRLQSAYGADMRSLFGATLFRSPRLALDEAMFAIARYQIESPDFHPFTSKYDAWLAGRARLTSAELPGYQAFNDPARGNCAACHLDQPTPDGQPPLFTDFQYEALGVPRNPAIPANRDPKYFDLGLCGPFRRDLAGQRSYCGMFLTPSLRNVATRRVFFHNGAFHSLRDVLDWYVNRDLHPERFYPRDRAGRVILYDDLPPAARANVDTLDAPFDRRPGDAPALSSAEIDDVIAFLGTLTDGYSAPRAAPAD